MIVLIAKFLPRIDPNLKLTADLQLSSHSITIRIKLKTPAISTSFKKISRGGLKKKISDMERRKQKGYINLDGLTFPHS